MFAPSPKALAQLVISQRKKLKLSQAAVGALVGLKQQTVSDFERNPDATQLNTLFRILSAVKLDLNAFPKDEQPKSKSKLTWQAEW